MCWPLVRAACCSAATLPVVVAVQSCGVEVSVRGGTGREREVSRVRVEGALFARGSLAAARLFARAFAAPHAHAPSHHLAPLPLSVLRSPSRSPPPLPLSVLPLSVLPLSASRSLRAPALPSRSSCTSPSLCRRRPIRSRISAAPLTSALCSISARRPVSVVTPQPPTALPTAHGHPAMSRRLSALPVPFPGRLGVHQPPITPDGSFSCSPHGVLLLL